MSTMEKMQVLSDMAQYDLCDKVSDFKKSQVNLPGIYHACGANGCQVPCQINAKTTANIA